ncbi:MAG: hypothetical protein HZA24_04480 [Nitrospirae bacterium]|nr:hypothetical protein [Nitrospirota bacterium]
MFNDKPLTWEYRVEHLSQVQMANQLNFMGKDGWELVAVVHSPEGEYPYECFLKRPTGTRF